MKHIIDKMLEHGIHPPSSIIDDGKLHRFNSEDSNNNKKNGWYVCYKKGDYGCFGCWKLGINVPFSDSGKTLTAIELLKRKQTIAEAQKLAQAEREKNHIAAATTALDIWESATEATEDHPYLKKKQVQAHGLRVLKNGMLIVPLYNSDNKLSSLQYISKSGDKTFLKSGSVAGCFYTLYSKVGQEKGKTCPDSKLATVFIAEGFATAASIHESTGITTIAAMSAQNIPSVAKIAAGKYDQVIVVADNDVGAGERYAIQAAQQDNIKYTVAPRRGDINDYARAGGNVAAFLGVSKHEKLLDIDDSKLDLLKPPGFCGQLVDWINARSIKPRKNLAVAAALFTTGNLGGLKFKCSHGITSNLMFFATAESGTGKDGIEKCIKALHKEAGLVGGWPARLKSDTALVRHFVHSPTAFYVADEAGEDLAKIKSAIKSGGATYLVGVFGVLMSIFTKADSEISIDQDLRITTVEYINKKIAEINKRKDENEEQKNDDYMLCDYEAVLASLEYSAFYKPFLSYFGISSPASFMHVFDEKQAKNGLIARAIVVQEKDTSPRRNRDALHDLNVNWHMSDTLKKIAAGGKRGQEKEVIRDTKEAAELLVKVEEEIEQLAEDSKENGLEALWHRAFEQVLKVSLCLAIPSQLREVEHVEWAFEYVKRNQQEKMNLVLANIAEEYKDTNEEIARKILNCLTTESKGVGITASAIHQRMRAKKKADIIKSLMYLQETNQAYQKEVKNQVNGRSAVYWYLSSN